VAYRLSYNLAQTKAGNYGPEYLYPDDTRGYEQRNFQGNSFRSTIVRITSVPTCSTRSHRMKVWNSLHGAVWWNIIGVTYPFNRESYRGSAHVYICEDPLVNRRYPLESVFDLNAVKTFTVGAYQMTLGVRVMNLFNNKWLTPMEGDDRTDWVNDGITVEDPARDPRA